MSRTRVAVLLGGTSPERGISLKTGRAVLEALPRDTFETTAVEILADGRWQVGSGAPGSLATGLGLLADLEVQVVFPGLHGRFGEDGTIQGLLEVAGLPYVGSGVTASAVCMDKVRTRDVLNSLGLPIPPGVEVREDPAASARLLVEELGLPLVVKDPEGGSSIDVTLTETMEEAERALASLLRRPARRALVEQHVPGREFTCGVLGNASVGGEVTALPALLVNPTLCDWCDFETKYAKGGLQKIARSPGDEAVLEWVESTSVTVHRELRCDGLTRTDFIVPEDGEPVILEVNTLPGLTETSLCPDAARVAGITFPELLARLVRMALDVFAAKQAGAGKEP